MQQLGAHLVELWLGAEVRGLARIALEVVEFLEGSREGRSGLQAVFPGPPSRADDELEPVGTDHGLLALGVLAEDHVPALRAGLRFRQRHQVHALKHRRRPGPRCSGSWPFRCGSTPPTARCGAPRRSAEWCCPWPIEAAWSTRALDRMIVVALNPAMVYLGFLPTVMEDLLWNAYFPIPFLISAIVVAWVVGSHSLGWWPVLVFVGSVAAQTHLIYTITSVLLVLVGTLHRVRAAGAPAPLAVVWRRLCRRRRSVLDRAAASRRSSADVAISRRWSIAATAVRCSASGSACGWWRTPAHRCPCGCATARPTISLCHKTPCQLEGARHRLPWAWPRWGPGTHLRASEPEFAVPDALVCRSAQ